MKILFKQFRMYIYESITRNKIFTCNSVLTFLIATKYKKYRLYKIYSVRIISKNFESIIGAKRQV